MCVYIHVSISFSINISISRSASFLVRLLYFHFEINGFLCWSSEMSENLICLCQFVDFIFHSLTYRSGLFVGNFDDCFVSPIVYTKVWKYIVFTYARSIRRYLRWSGIQRSIDYRVLMYDSLAKYCLRMIYTEYEEIRILPGTCRGGQVIFEGGRRLYHRVPLTIGRCRCDLQVQGCHLILFIVEVPDRSRLLPSRHFHPIERVSVTPAFVRSWPKYPTGNTNPELFRTAYNDWKHSRGSGTGTPGGISSAAKIRKMEMSVSSRTRTRSDFMRFCRALFLILFLYPDKEPPPFRGNYPQFILMSRKICAGPIYDYKI